MFFRLLMVFILVPSIELILLIKLGQVIGILWTFTIIVFTGLLGVSLAKQQGLMVLQEIRAQLNAGVMPSDAVIEGLLILGGSLFLLTPGLLTDLTGFSTLIPATRAAWRQLIKNRIQFYIQTGRWRFY
ncbi:FxsA family protein [Metallumcola ferriviriculae]|uniref:FxsA family protein n=1 Tax=Metallumcola ferriviriculae TaxID=3039180 RepID=A0AAU0UPQ0_9FIRM|nr:FxsA family protein [Desulfitibacteraceae bacterium MK1]